MLLAMLSAGGAAAVAGPEREPELRAALVEALAGCRRPDGGYSRRQRVGDRRRARGVASAAWSTRRRTRWPSRARSRASTTAAAT